MRRRPLPTRTIAGDDGSCDVYGILRHAARTLRGHAHAYVFGPFDLRRVRGMISTEPIVWDKGRAMSVGNLSLPWGRTWEPIQFGVWSGSPGSAARSSEDGKGRLSARKRRGTVLHYPRLNGTRCRDHLTPKPVPLLRELIESSSCPGDLLLDPFAGAGSTLVAAVIEGRRAIGIEIEERYCEIAARRVEEAQQVMAPVVGL
jgi:hypothetical protein